MLGDIRRNVADLERSDLSYEAKEYMRGTVWPFLESFVEAVDSHFALQAEAIAEIEAGEAECLHPETAKLLATTITVGVKLAAELMKRLPPGDPASAKLATQIDTFGKMAEAALEEIEQITIDAAEDDEDVDDDDEDDDEDDDDEEDR